MSLVNYLEKQDNLFTLKDKPSIEQIKEAEKILHLHFSKEFIEYTLKYGSVSYDNHELTGVVSPERLSVVATTLKERRENSKFPTNLYIIENIGVDSLKVAQDENGYIYYTSKPNKKIANSLEEYLMNF